MSTPRKRWSEMTTEELAEATKEYDRPMPGLPGKPLTAAQKKTHRDAARAAAERRKVGRPLKGEGTRRRRGQRRKRRVEASRRPGQAAEGAEVRAVQRRTQSAARDQPADRQGRVRRGETR